MKIAMGALALLAIVGGFLQIPGVSAELHHFLEPTFADSELYETLEPTATQEWLGLMAGGIIGLVGIAIAYRIYGKGGNAAAAAGALRRPAHVLRQQVVLRRGDRLPDRAAVRLVRALRQQHRSSACSSTARSSAAGPDGKIRGAVATCAGLQSGTCATTRRCCSSASPGSAPTSWISA